MVPNQNFRNKSDTYLKNNSFLQGITGILLMTIAMQGINASSMKVLNVLNNISVAMIFATTGINVVVSSFFP